MTHPTTCNDVRDLLLDHLYGALEGDEAAAVESHLAGCDTCRAALAAASRQSDVFAEAARAEAGDLDFRTPPARRDVPIFRPLFAAAAAAGLLVGVFALGGVGQARARAVAANPVVEIRGPRTVVAGVPAEYRVRSATLDGAPVARKFVASVAGPDGAWREVGTASVGAGSPDASMVLDPGALAPGASARLLVQELAPDGDSLHAWQFPLVDGTRLVSRVSTDKPLYRPGETVRARAVALEGLRLTPAGDAFVRLRLFDPRGGIVFDRALPTLSGVTAWQHEIPADAPGGTWRLVASGVPGKTGVAESEREFQVRAFRAPRLRFDTELDRDSYRPGDSGSAMLKVVRAEGGVPQGAKAEATLRIDGAVASTQEVAVGPDGGIVVPFSIPRVVEEGTASLTVTVHDGGSVETTVKTVPLLTDTVRFEWFPEGGTLVAGLPNRVYFRARTPADEPADLDAELRDSSGRTVARVKADVLGMGAFDLTPAADETYRVVFATTGKPVGEGATLTAAREGTTLRALDERTAARAAIPVRVASTEGGRYTVGAWCRGIPVADAQVDVPRGGSADVRLPVATDAGGVLRVTVFDPQGLPVAERLVAREPARRLDVTVVPERPKTAPRETVKVGVTVRDEDGRPTQTVLGVSVADASMLALADDRDAAPLPLHFLLGMEVRDLEEVAKFADGPGAARAYDRVLGVQGWRRFSWKDPATFAAANPEAAEGIAVVAAADVPNVASTAGDAQVAVDWATRHAKRDAGHTALAFAGLAVFAGALWVGFRAAAARRAPLAYGGFTLSALLVLGFAVTAVVPTMQDAAGARVAVHAAPELAVAAGAEAVEGWELDDGAAVVLAEGAAVELERSAPAGGSAPEELRFDIEDARDVKAREAGARRLQELGKKLVLRDKDGGRLDRLALDELTAMGGTPATGADGDFEVELKGGGAGPRVGLLARLERVDASRVAGVLVREYVHRAAPAADGARSDFADVLYWNPLLVTDENGKASFDFDTSDAITAFEVGVDAHDGRGALGAGKAEFSNRVPFWAEPKFPAALTAGDTVLLPVVVANDGVRPLDVTATATLDGKLLAAERAPTGTVQVAPDARGRVLIPFVALQQRGTTSLTVDATAAGNLRDRSVRTMEVFPRGFPIAEDRSGVLEKQDATTVVLPDDLDRVTLLGGLRLYPSMLATLVDGLEGMLGQPGGCFEQASSTNYPNVMVLNYLQEQGAASPDVARRAKDLLGRGYALLTGYECKRKGYEWFGSDPGHEALTAYGLMEFADMAKVHDVDPKMVERTRDWLLTRRDGKGGFLRDAKALDSFGRAPAETTDAYVTWALTEADGSVDLSAELSALAERARTSEDPYLVALAANALSNRSHASAVRILDRLAAMQRKDGGFDGKTASITSSTGVNLEVETTALAVLAFARNPASLARAEAGVRFLLSHRTNGSFHATQATILSLRALAAHAKASKRTATAHEITVLVDGKVVATRFVPKGSSGVIEFDSEIVAALHPGENRIEFRTSGSEVLPWAFRVEYSTDRPADAADCAVGVTARLGKVSVREGETVDLTATVVNRTDESVPMTIARLGVPAGLEPRAARLEEMKKAGAIDFFELRPREVVLYWRGLAPKAEKKVTVELTAAIPGRYEGPASSAYLYYGDDKKVWAEPLRCEISAAE